MAGGLGYLGGVNLSTGALCGPTGPTARSGGTTTSSSTTTTTTTGPTATTVPTTTTGPRRPRGHDDHGAHDDHGPADDHSAHDDHSARADVARPRPTPGAACVKPANEAVQGAVVSMATVSVLVASAPEGSDGSQCAGYWVVTRSGDVAAFGSAVAYGSLEGTHLNAPIVGIAPTRDYGGYWLVASDGSGVRVR